MAQVQLDDLTREYPGAPTPAVDALSLNIEDGEFLVLVGPSGCGKSTTLRMLAGLETVDGGAISIDGRVVNDVPPKDRDIAMVFQNYALYPHMSVRSNIGFHLKVKRMETKEAQGRVSKAAALLDLVSLLDRKPGQLSGGQRQRVAMGRAIVREPKAFLMDEPLSNLDAKLRVQTRTQIADLQRRLHVTTVYVTHDQVEAMTMGDRVAVLDRGRLQQVDTPRRLFARPVNTFVASFIGSPAMNLLDVPILEGKLRFGAQDLPMALARPLRGGRLKLGLRPEAVRLTQEGTGLTATVRLVEELGSDAFLYTTTALGEVVVRVVGLPSVERGQTVEIAADPAQLHLFDAQSGERVD